MLICAISFENFVQIISQYWLAGVCFVFNFFKFFIYFRKLPLLKAVCWLWSFAWHVEVVIVCSHTCQLWRLCPALSGLSLGLQVSWSAFPVILFLFNILRGFCFKLRSLIHFKLIFVQNERYISNFILQVDIKFVSKICCKGFLFSSGFWLLLLLPLSEGNCPELCEFIPGLLVCYIPLVICYKSVFVKVPCCLYYYGSLV